MDVGLGLHRWGGVSEEGAEDKILAKDSIWQEEVA